MRLYFTSLILSLALLTNAQKKNGGNTWYKGNTHTHSYWSDGDDFPENIMEWYKSHQYDFICLSDHNTLATGEKWKLIPAFPSHEKRFFEYLKKYGDSWVTYKRDSVDRIRVKLKTYEEYRPLFEEKGKFLIMQAEEISASYEKKPIHIGAINVKELVAPQGGNSVSEVMQNNLNAVYEQRKRTSQDMFAHINHPNFMWAVTLEDMLNLNGERFFEVYNGHPLVHNYGDSLRPGTEEMWDKLLLNCFHKKKPLIYGLATDDAHNYLSYSTRESNPGRGYVMVKAKELTAPSIIQAMEKGDFYSSTGVELEEIHFTKSRLTIKVKPQRGVTYKIQFLGAKQNGINPVLLLQLKGRKAHYTFKKGDIYVRAKIISSRYKENPFQEGDFETAWTQPILNPIHSK
jgi:hypothetical protein